eukprot:m.90305 g.90305  ORF g.90305 m.90305 type:complete len:62 (-) comp51094_c0_seq2:59-244(-)
MCAFEPVTSNGAGVCTFGILMRASTRPPALSLPKNQSPATPQCSRTATHTNNTLSLKGVVR